MREHWDPETKQWMPVDDEPVQAPNRRRHHHPLVWLLLVVLAVPVVLLVLALAICLWPLTLLFLIDEWGKGPLAVRVVGPQ